MLLRRPANHRRHFDRRRIPASHLPPGAVLLVLSTLTTAATLSLAHAQGSAIYCDRLAPLAVLATLAAALLALAFRSLASASRHRLLYTALLLSAVSLFLSARFIAHCHTACSTVEQQLHPPRSRP